jgi:hypothetical protein
LSQVGRGIDIDKTRIRSIPFTISEPGSYDWLRDFLILHADTGVRFTKFGTLHGGHPAERSLGTH